MNETPTSTQPLRKKTAQVKAELAVITGTATNGTIIATADSAGHLRDLKLPRTRHGSVVNSRR